MKKRSIYTSQSQEIFQLFEEAGTYEKVLCIPIDYAKKDHTVMFCNGHGDILRKPFAVKNSPEGIEYLVDQVKRSCRHRRIRQKHVFFGGEDVGSYAENFINTLRSDGWLVAGVNAQDAKKQRMNLQASTDRIDLMGIAATLLNRRANFSPAQSGIYRNLRQVVRHRRILVGLGTQVKNRMHTVVDRLFPGFLDEAKSGILPFSKASLWFMEDRLSSVRIRRRKSRGLVRDLKRLGVTKPEEAAARVQQYAGKVLKPPGEHIYALQLSLGQHVKLYRSLQENIEQMEKEISLLLAQTQGAFLTSCRGIGIVLAAGVTAEIGNPYYQKALNNLASYAGIIPRVKQTGGPEGRSSTGHVAKRCNRILKDYLGQSANHLGLHGPEELMADYKRRQAAGQHADFGMARRYLRMCMSLMRRSQVYLPSQLRKPGSTREDHAAYYLTLWPALREKWNKYGALKAAFAEDRPLGQWRNRVQERYEIELQL
jgi:transposase